MDLKEIFDAVDMLIHGARPDLRLEALDKLDDHISTEVTVMALVGVEIVRAIRDLIDATGNR